MRDEDKLKLMKVALNSNYGNGMVYIDHINYIKTSNGYDKGSHLYLEIQNLRRNLEKKKKRKNKIRNIFTA